METEISDLYHASFLLLSGCSLEGVRCIPTGGALSCLLSFQGDKVDELTEAWLNKKATANLWAFRSAYNQINAHVHQAKKSYDHARRGSV